MQGSIYTFLGFRLLDLKPCALRIKDELLVVFFRRIWGARLSHSTILICSQHRLISFSRGGIDVVIASELTEEYPRILPSAEALLYDDPASLQKKIIRDFLGSPLA